MAPLSTKAQDIRLWPKHGDWIVTMTVTPDGPACKVADDRIDGGRYSLIFGMGLTRESLILLDKSRKLPGFSPVTVTIDGKIVAAMTFDNAFPPDGFDLSGDFQAGTAGAAQLALFMQAFEQGHRLSVTGNGFSVTAKLTSGTAVMDDLNNCLERAMSR